MGEADQIAEGQNLPFMSVACKHKAYACLGGDVYIPRRMRNKHRCGCRRSASQRLPYQVAGVSGVSAAG
jgi:hypothetical protein